MSTPNQSFELTPRELARQDAVVEMLINRAQTEGLRVERAALLMLPAVRMAVLTDLGLDQDSAMEQMRQIPVVAEQVRKIEAVRQLNDADSPMQAELTRMNPHQRVTLGHQLEAAQKTAAVSATRNPNMDAVEEARILLMLRKMDPASRISAARAAGLI